MNALVNRGLNETRHYVLEGVPVVGNVVEDVKGLGCGRVATRVLKATGAHKTPCLWDYYFECLVQTCGYQSNLAKYFDADCTCHKGS